MTKEGKKTYRLTPPSSNPQLSLVFEDLGSLPGVEIHGTSTVAHFPSDRPSRPINWEVSAFKFLPPRGGEEGNPSDKTLKSCLSCDVLLRKEES